MVIKRIYNHNVVLATKANGEEVVLIGKGLAFGSTKGDAVDSEKITKVFTMTQDVNDKFATIIKDIPYEYLLLSEEVINKIKEKSSQELNDGIYVTLTEHIDNLVNRIEMGIVFDATLLLNVKNLYKEEYALGQMAVKMIQDRLSIEIDESEASFIALHIINAKMDSNMNRMYEITKLIEDILAVVLNHFDIDFSGTNGDRFITHCRFFANRVLDENDNKMETNVNSNSYALMKYSYKKQADCIEEIEKLFLKKYGYYVDDNEKLYLLLHLIKLTEV